MGNQPLWGLRWPRVAQGRQRAKWLTGSSLFEFFDPIAYFAMLPTACTYVDAAQAVMHRDGGSSNGRRSGHLHSWC